MSSGNEKTLLIYGFNDEEKSTLVNILKEANLPQYKVINESMIDTTIESILSNEENNKDGSQEFGEKVILFYKLQDDEITKAMRTIKASLAIKPIFAVVTPTSIKWKFNELLEHLIEERNWYESKSKK